MKYIAILLTIASIACYGQGSINMTPKKDLGLKPQKLQVPQKFKDLVDTNFVVNLPEGYHAKVFCANINVRHPRFLGWSPDSVLHVADYAGMKIWAMPDRNHDGVADTVYKVADRISANNLAFYKGNLYASESVIAYKLTDTNSDGFYELKEPFITGIGDGTAGGNHTTRTIVFDSVNKKLYISVGSSCNVCRETNRGVIEQYNDDGTGKRIFARGIRNAVGITLHPVTGKLWADNMGSDLQGDDIPPEWIDIVRENGFYGFPIAHSYQVYFDFQKEAEYKALLPITKKDSDDVRSMVQPAALIQAHSAPLQMEFSNESFPQQFRYGAFIAYHGSWNRTIATGYKVAYFGFDNPNDTTADYVADFLTGFLTDSTSKIPECWGRPAGIAVDHRGNLYVTSDSYTKMVIIVHTDSSVGVGDDRDKGIPDINIYPNPASEYVNVKCRIPGTYRQENTRLRLFDALGAELKSYELNITAGSAEGYTSIKLNDFPSGIYCLRLDSGTASLWRRFVVVK